MMKTEIDQLAMVKQLVGNKASNMEMILQSTFKQKRNERWPIPNLQKEKAEIKYAVRNTAFEKYQLTKTQSSKFLKIPLHQPPLVIGKSMSNGDLKAILSDSRNNKVMQ